MSIKFANNAFGTLNAGISSSDTSITLSSGQGARFPALATGEYFYITLIDTANNLEVVKCTARSTDVLTIVRAQDNTTARAFVIGDRVELRVTAAALEDTGNPYDKDTSSTGGLALPKGTTAQEPVAADSEGYIRYDTDLNTVTFSNGTDWFKIAASVAQLSSVTGTIYDGAASTLTLTGSGFLAANLVVNFTQTSDGIDEDVTVTPASDTSATVSVPAAVYNNVTAGNVVSVSVTNSDGMQSGAVSKTALAVPTGGTVSTSGGYRYHKFTSSGTFTNTVASLSVEHVIVAGGGGGGDNHGGGGGAGGLISGSGTLSTGNFSVTVGAGGSYGHAPTSGGNSSFNGNTANGGGSGGSGDPGQAPASGGSGGGAGGHSTPTFTGASGTSGQGNDGGDGLDSGSSIKNGGGGGGKGAAGQDASSGNAGDGGNGSNAYSTWATATSSGASGYYAGGGGGGCWTDQSQVPGTGGAGGGGAGGQYGNVQGGAGAANTGGGGGGGDDGQGLGGNGGSGIVLLRYQLT